MRYGILGLASCIAVLSLCHSDAGAQETNAAFRDTCSAAATKSTDAAVTPVHGPSLLERGGRFLNETSMGKTGAWGPPPTQGGAPRQAEEWFPGWMAQRMGVSGSDLYRLNCQACHQPTGEGVPPEINSIIDPVQATSPELILQRMKKVGTPMSPATARQLASQAETSLLQRIHNGGQNMPPFPHLSAAEVRALRAYLNQLASVPGAKKKQMHLEEPAIRVGEHVVKSTCHVCHSATGPNPSPQRLLAGAIPPLSVLATRTDLQAFVRKVTEGAPIVMGALNLPNRGRMPVFYYLRKDEAAAAYLYLRLCPP